MLMATLSLLVERAERAAVRKLLASGELCGQDVKAAVQVGVVSEACLNEVSGCEL
jgi:hypothetical protein